MNRLTQLIFACACLFFVFTKSLNAQCVLNINEIHYNQTGADADYVEVRIANPQPADLTGYFVQLYNGTSNPNAAVTYTPALQLASATVTSSGGYSYYVMTGSIQNGDFDGMALVAPCGPGGASTVIEFISYQGTITASNGSAAGMTSTHIGVSENDATPITVSLQLVNGFWSGPLTQTSGQANIAPATTCLLDSVKLVSLGQCNGFNSTYSVDLTIYSTMTPATGFLNVNGQVFIIEASPQTITLTNLPADGQAVDVVAGFTSDPGCFIDSVSFFQAPASCLNCADLNLRINEFHYDDPGTPDGDEFIELRSEYALPFDPSLITLYMYDGADSMIYRVVPLTEFTLTSNNGFHYYTYEFGNDQFQNGPRDGLALASPCGVSEFISYEGMLTALDGPAIGLPSTNVGVSENPVAGNSLQIIGSAWQGPIPNTFAAANEPFLDCLDSLEINIINPILCGGDTLEIQYPQGSMENQYSLNFNPLVQLVSEELEEGIWILKVRAPQTGILEIEYSGIIHGCQTPVSHYFIAVEEAIIPNGGPDKEVCSGGMVAMEAEGSGIWSGGQGQFSNVNDPMAAYSPSAGEENTTVELYWAQTNSCGTYTDTVLVNVTAPSEIYQMNCIAQVNFSLGLDCIPDLTFEDVLSSFPDGETFGVLIYDQFDRVISTSQPMDRSLVGGTYKYVAFGPFPCNNNSCWGEVTIEDKVGPSLVIPEDLTINCLESTDPSALGTATGEDCGDVAIKHHDFYENFECNIQSTLLRRIDRVWYAIDDAGNVTSDTQRIYVTNIGINEINPPEILVELECGSDTSPDSIASKLGVQFGYPFYYDERIAKAIPLTAQSICKYVATYTDSKPISACGPDCASSYKILRTWVVLDWCAGGTYNFNQIIKLVDHTAPVIKVESPGKAFSTDAWSCSVDIPLPIAVVDDNCDEHAKILTIEGPLGSSVQLANGKWLAYDVPKGESEFIYTASDCCGNVSTATITVVVEDKIHPVAIVKEHVTLSLTNSHDTIVPGVAKLTIDMIDNGSYDNCSDVYLEIRRDATMPTCLNEGDLWNHDSNTSTPEIPWNNNRTFNNNTNGLGQNNLIHLNDRGDDTDRGQFVTFCCEDVSASVIDIDGDGKNDVGYHKVWLRVWDDSDMDGIFGSRGDLYSETWAIVKVEDKTTPRIVCERDITTYCDEADFVLSMNKWTDVAGNVPAEYWPWIDGVCTDLPLEFMDEGTITTCNTTLERSPLTRTYRIKGTTITCTSSLYILDRETSPKLDWPIALHTWTKCELTVEDVLNNTVKATGINNIKIMGTVETQEVILEDVLAYVPYYWYEWMGTGHNSPNLGQYCLGSQNNSIASSGSNGVTPTDGGLIVELQGKTRFNPNWQEIGCRVFGRKIIIDEYEVGEGCKKWLVRFEYIDWCNPDWAACVTTIYKYEDTTPGEIVVSMSDTISVDPTCNTSWTTMPMGDDGGGCDVGFYWEVTLSKAGYTKTITATGNGPKVTFTGLGSGKYNVHYKLTDGCGNVSEKEAMLVIIGKDPTPYCISLSSAVMKNGVVELWARDFDNNSYPNCIVGNLYFTFENAHPVWTKLNQYHFFMGEGIEVMGADTLSLYQAGIAQKWIPDTRTSGKLFGCTVGDGSSFPVSKIKMTVWDADFLSDYCEVTLSLVDNQDACGAGSMVTVAGNIKTEFDLPLANANVQIRGNTIGFPKNTKTNSRGEYAFIRTPIGIDYEIGASLDTAYRNGVNTLDLLHIQRHILALQRIDSPYKLIAADSDNDENVTVSDLVELRKIILGVINDLPNNQSWRFVDKKQQMGEKPWPFEEVMNHQMLMENQMNDDFIAVKIGDIDGSASTSFQRIPDLSPRNIGLHFIAQDRALKAGEEMVVDIIADSVEDLYGFQLNAKINGIEITSIDGRAIQFSTENFAIINGNELTMSWHNAKPQTVVKGQPVLSIKIKATKSGLLSEMIQLSNTTLTNEAYVGDDFKAVGIQIEFRNDQKGIFDVKQNTPNPWKGETLIAFELPESGQVKLGIRDVTGKLMLSKYLPGTKGLNQLILNKSDINIGSGVFIYSIESGQYSAQKRMIIID